MKQPVHETNLPPTCSRPLTLHHTHWLVVLLLSEHGLTLHKGAFRDTIRLRYGWQLLYLQSHSICMKKFTVEHAFSCPCGRFPSLRHGDIRDITADYLTEVSPSVPLEPTPTQRASGTLLTIWKAFHYSPQKAAKLAEIQTELVESPEIKMQKPSGTHWLACEGAVRAV